jgi:hypothetical protein
MVMLSLSIPNLRAICLTWRTCLREGEWFLRRTSTLVWALISYSRVEVGSCGIEAVAMAYYIQVRI